MIRDSHRVALMLALAGTTPALAQQFVQETGARFPAPFNEYTNQCTLADYDHDGDIDVAFANGGNFGSPGAPQTLRLYINDGTGVFTDESDARHGGLEGNIRDVQFGDVDNDGDLDMVAAQDFNKAVFLYLNDGSGFFTDASGQLPAITIACSHVAFGDVDNDGDLDLALNNGTTTRFGSGPTQLWLNNGTGVFTDATATNLPVANVSQPMDTNFGDLDGDLDLDLIVSGRANTNTRLFFNNGDGTFSLGAWPGDNSTYSFDLGDYDNDGDLDVLGVNSGAASREALYENDGNGVFVDVAATALPGANNPTGDDNDSKFFEIDYDGFLDLVVCHLGSPREKIWFNDAGVFMLDPTIITNQTDSSLDVEVADFDDDGDLDMITAQGESGSFTNRYYNNVGKQTDILAPRIEHIEQLADAEAPGNYPVRANIRDDNSSDTGAWLSSVVLEYEVGEGLAVQVPMRWMGHQLYRGVIPQQNAGAVVTYSVLATDRTGNTGQSDEQSFTVLVGCAADCNADGQLNILDFVCFQNEWVTQSPAGDCDHNGEYNILDFVCFQNAFTAGCD